jgi:hypothetical protein
VSRIRESAHVGSVAAADAGTYAVNGLGLDIAARVAAIDRDALARYRLERVREQLRRHDYGAAVLSDPMNVRYATDTRNMAVWTLHAPGRYAFVPADGPVVLFEFSAARSSTSSAPARRGSTSSPARGSTRRRPSGRRRSAASFGPTAVRTAVSPSTGSSRGVPSCCVPKGCSCSTRRCRSSRPAW